MVALGSPPKALEPGARVGRYEIIFRPQVQRGLATTLIARDTALGRRVALKVAPLGDCLPLETEAQTLADLAHPNILAVYDVGEHLEYRYVAFEYVERTLEAEIDQRAVAIPRLVELLATMATTLDHVHRRGYLHCNVSPQVIRLDESGRPRLSGFQVRVDRSRLPAVVGGTPRYMAPEQVEAEGAELGPWTDVWGLGVALYLGLTGKGPFDAPTAQATLLNIVDQRPIPPRKVNAAVPEELEAICMKSLAKRPGSRYAGADELALALQNLHDHGTRQPSHRVFISHSGRDRHLVEDGIVFPLEANGISTWYSKVSIQTAAEWERSILGGLESCGWFLLAMSGRSADSEWVRDELHWAIENRPTRILPVLLEACEPRRFHIRMARLQSIGLYEDQPRAQVQLVEAILRIPT